MLQALHDAAVIDAKAANGSDITPLCGLPLAVKDAIDVLGWVSLASSSYTCLTLGQIIN